MKKIGRKDCCEEGRESGGNGSHMQQGRKSTKVLQNSDNIGRGNEEHNVIGMPKGHEKNERKRKAPDVPRSSDDTSDENMDDNDISNEGRDSKRKKQNYHHYIQKKMTPELFTDLIESLSDAQKGWIKETGFGKLLDFRMTKYAHWLGYDIVDSFDGETCSLKLKKGSILISDTVVNKVLGLPRGPNKIIFEPSSKVNGTWAKQFRPASAGHIYPWMIVDKIKDCARVTKLFKLNFLVLMSNFLIESNQNSFVKREILGFKGDLDACSQYNWCALVVEKLVSTHKFWAERKSTRFFAGSLAFLTYLYVDRVKSRVNTTVVRTIPAYIPWSDTLIGYEEKQTRRDNMFGEGEILPWTDDDVENENDEAVHANSGKTIIENRDVDGKEVTIRSSADERLCINKAREEQTSKHMESNGDEPRDENNMMAEPEDKELDEMVCMATLDRKIDQLGRRYRGIVAGITAAMEKYPDNPNIAELKVKLWKAMTTI